ncbi:MAG: HEAT repeat domain-containing protein, partial [Anaerolineae bacterium]|nr:HEAT repeat domain-containing protein [Anaerolineae bacterium]
ETLRARDPDVRIQALEALSANNTPAAIPVVQAALDDPDPDVVYNAVLSLVELRGEHGLPDLVARLRAASDPDQEPLLRGLFHATNYLHVDLADLPVIDDLLDALAGTLDNARARDIPAVRIAAVWLLAWTRHPRAAGLLVGAFERESSPTVQAAILRIAVSLMAGGADSLLEAGLASADPTVRAAAEQIRARQAAGLTTQYDESAEAAAPLRRDELIR